MGVRDDCSSELSSRKDVQYYQQNREFVIVENLCQVCLLDFTADF